MKEDFIFDLIKKINIVYKNNDTHKYKKILKIILKPGYEINIKVYIEDKNIIGDNSLNTNY